MLIFVAHSGKSLEIAVEPSTRVSTIVETLASVTNIRPADQILMCDGSRLDPAKDLLAYRLHGQPGNGSKDVFLYNKSNLRLNAPPPPVESAVPVPPEEPPAPQVQSAMHALDSASSPLIRGLPQYEHQFKLHLKDARAGLRAVRHRFTHCATLLSEMDVQSRAIDSARANVELHYTYIHNQIAAFMQRYTVQQTSHAEVLAAFEGELEALEAVDLHPAARTAEHTKLVHLVDATRLRDWAAKCSASHQSLAHKVAALEEVFGALKADVEAVFMQGPTVQLEALTVQLQAMQPHLDELTSIVEVLESDNVHIQKLVAAAQQKLNAFGRGAPGGVTPLDTCQLIETMHDNHTSHLGPQVEHYRAVFEHFYQRCLADKNQMTQDVSTQLQRISGQQMKIQSIRNKLAVFREAAAKGDELFAQLLLLRRIPAAYRQCLAECMRRQAFVELYGAQARQLAERMGKLREKERDMRDRFVKQVQAYVPSAVLAGLGLLHQPPHCQVSLPAQPRLPSVTPADLQRKPRSSEPAASAAALLPFGTAAGSPSPGARSSQDAAGKEGEGHPTESLQIENARLRAELAVRVAEECIQSLSRPLAEASSQRASQHGSEGQPLTARSSAATSASSSEVSRFQAALAAKQELVHQLERSLAQERQHVRNYESRIQALEARLAEQAARLRLKEPAASATRDSASSSYSPSGSGSSAGVTMSKKGAAPLALTPVSTSPTRSVSPVIRPAVAGSTELAEGCVSSSLGEGESERTDQHLASPAVADTAGQESTMQEFTALGAAVTGPAPTDFSGIGPSSGGVPGSDGQQ